MGLWSTKNIAKLQAEADSEGLKRSLKAGKRVVVTLRFSPKARATLTKVLEAAPKGLPLMLSFKGSAGKLTPAGRTARTLLVR